MRVVDDHSLTPIHLESLPSEIELWLEKDCIEYLPDPVIVDYQRTDKIELTFIPPLPRPMEEYDFYDHPKKNPTNPSETIAIQKNPRI